MKKLIYILALSLITGVYAQENNPVNVTEETEVKTIKVKKGDKVIENKISIKTEQTQEVKIDPKNEYDLNGDVIETPIKVTKTVKVDNDNDPYYDSKTKVTYYKFDSKDYTFIPDDKGFVVSIKEGDEDVYFGKARYSKRHSNYIISTTNYTGVGYFEKDGSFVIEYYDGKSDGIVTKEFKITK